jgi:hypothetical protein
MLDRLRPDSMHGRYALTLVCLATLIGFALRLPLNDSVPPRWDEGWSIAHASLGLGELLIVTAADVHPPLYYLVLSAWQALAGHDLFAARYLSVSMSATAMPLAFVAAVAWTGSRRVAIFAALFMAWLPLGVYYGAVVRMYALAPSLVLLAAWGALRIVGCEFVRRAPEPARERLLPSTLRPRPSFMPVAAFVLGATGAILTLYHAAWALAAIGVYAFVIALRTARGRALGRALGRLLIAVGLALVLYLPWAIYGGPQFLGRAAAEAATNIGQRYPIGYFLRQGIADLTMSQQLGDLGPIVIGLILAAGAAIAAVRRRPVLPILLPALMMALTLAGVAFAARQWAFNARMLICAVPGLALALAWAFEELIATENAAAGRIPLIGRHLFAAIAALVLVGIYLPTSLGPVYGKTLEVFDPYDPHTYRAHIAPHAQPGDIAIFNVLSPAGFYALDRQPSDPGWTYALTWDPVIEPRSRWEDRIGRVMSEGGRAWLVLYRGLAGKNGDLRGWMDTTYYPAHAEWGAEEVYYGLYGAGGRMTPGEGAGATWSTLRLTDIRIGTDARAGQVLPIALTWQSAAPVDKPYKVFVHAFAPDGRLIAQHDAQPLNDLRPMTTWMPGEHVRDHHGLALPPDYRGPLTIVIGLYDPATGARLQLADGRDALEIGAVSVA